ncbi:SDR family oxidoreductase [Limibacter armeniacum]|uniref:SDR family oxidoreductase n=1 Tax=Limibacter armeniacum TaxID=466084 RepID=UPI002FE60216
MKNILITGTSSGIGFAASKAFIEKGYRVFGSVRKDTDAATLRSKLGENFYPLVFDVTDLPAIKEAKNEVEQVLGNKAGLDCLINNAGIAVAGPLLHITAEELRFQMEVNLIGMLHVTQVFAPLLGATRNFAFKPGKIINISSAAGKLSYPFIGPYCASKHAVEGFSNSLRQELMLYGIDVVVVGPGEVITEIWDKAEEIDLEAYTDTDFYESGNSFKRFFVKKGRSGMPVAQVGQKLVKIAEKNRPALRYPLVKDKLTAWWLPLLLPKRIVNNMVANILKLRKRDLPNSKPEVVKAD